MASSIAKQYIELLKCLRGLTDGQAEVSLPNEEFTSIELILTPNGGLYRGGKYKFQISLSDRYPREAPVIHCETCIYHPNIDFTCEYETRTNLCVSLLHEWTPSNDLKDCVMALLFILYNPNLEENLAPWWIKMPKNEEEFAKIVELTMQGGLFNGRRFVNFRERHEPDDNKSNKYTQSSDNEAENSKLSHSDPDMPNDIRDIQTECVRPNSSNVESD